MFRIHFDASSACWLVQFLQFHLYWSTVQGANFQTLNQAREYVATTGISSHYAEKFPCDGKEWMMPLGVKQP